MTVSRTHENFNATSEDVANEFSVSVRTVRNWLRKGIITGHRIGPRLIRYDLDQVREQLIDNKSGSPVRRQDPTGRDAVAHVMGSPSAESWYRQRSNA